MSPSEPSPRPAPTYSIPTTSIASIEYPGPVRNTPTSLSAALTTLGGPSKVSHSLSSLDSILQLNFRPHAPFSHSLASDTVPEGEASHAVVLKVVKRSRRRTKTKIVGEQVLDERGVYTVQCLGRVERVVRFRAMADLQYEQEWTRNDPTVQLAQALKTMNVDTLQQYRFPEPTEDFEDADLRLLPPPVFSRLSLPTVYAYRANPHSTAVTTTLPDGSEVTRLVNKAKYRGEMLQTVPFTSASIPSGPPPSLLAQKDSKPGLESQIIAKLERLFEERPVWSRAGLLNHCTKLERSRINNYKSTLPFVSWTFSDGPYREALIRFGYDPRQHREARFYQRITMRNMANSKVYLKRIQGASTHTEHDVREKDSDSVSHVFDGERVHRNIANFQLCDISEPLLYRLVHDEEFVLDHCDARDGWYDTEYFEVMRQCLRRKFLALLNEGRQLPEHDFADLFAHLESVRALRAETGDGAGEADQSLFGGVEEGDGENVQEGSSRMRAASATPSVAGGKGFISLKRKHKRSAKPKAKPALGDKAERARSRISATAEPDPGPSSARHDMEELSLAGMEEDDTIMEEDEEEAEG